MQNILTKVLMVAYFDKGWDTIVEGSSCHQMCLRGTGRWSTPGKARASHRSTHPGSHPSPSYFTSIQIKHIIRHLDKYFILWQMIWQSAKYVDKVQSISTNDLTKCKILGKEFDSLTNNWTKPKAFWDSFKAFWDYWTLFWQSHTFGQRIWHFDK